MITKDGRGLLKDHIISKFTSYKIGTGGDSTNPNATDLDSPISSMVSVTPTGSSESAIEWKFTVQGSAYIGNTIKEVGIFDNSDPSNPVMLVRVNYAAIGPLTSTDEIEFVIVVEVD